MTTKTELAQIMRRVLNEHDHGALGGNDLAETLAHAALNAHTESDLEPVILAAEVAWRGRGRHEPLSKAIARDVAAHLRGEL